MASLVALALTLLGLFAFPSRWTPIAEPLERDGDTLRMQAEPWGTGEPTILAAIGLAAIACGVEYATHDVVAWVIASAAIALLVVGVVDGRLRHRPTEALLTADTLEIIRPRAFGAARERIALRHIRSIELAHGSANAEINFREYVCRYLRLVLADGRPRRVPLPMEQGPGDVFHSELVERIAKLPHPDDAPLIALVETLGVRVDGYREHRGMIDRDRRGFARDGVAVRIVRDGTRFRITIRAGSETVEHVHDELPTAEEVSATIAAVKPNADSRGR